MRISLAGFRRKQLQQRNPRSSGTIFRNVESPPSQLPPHSTGACERSAVLQSRATCRGFATLQLRGDSGGFPSNPSPRRVSSRALEPRKAGERAASGASINAATFLGKHLKHLRAFLQRSPAPRTETLPETARGAYLRPSDAFRRCPDTF